MFSCDIDECAISDKLGRAVEMHFRLRGGVISAAWPCCASCVETSKKMDAEYDERWSKHRATFLYLPIVQPVVGSEQAIAMEVALHAACRLFALHDGRLLAVAIATADASEATGQRRLAEGNVMKRPVISWADGGEG